MFKTEKLGFTLIELLAVIVVLTIIAVVATPIVVKTIDDAKKGAFKNSAYGLIKAAELDYSKNLLKDSKPKKITYTYENNIETSDQSGYKLDYKGLRPQNGKIIINEKGEIALAIHNGKWCAIKGYKDKEIEVSVKKLEDCEIKVPTLMAASYGGSTSGYLNGPLLKNQIESIEFKTTNKVPSDAIGSWDVSFKKTGQ